MVSCLLAGEGLNWKFCSCGLGKEYGTKFRLFITKTIVTILGMLASLPWKTKGMAIILVRDLVAISELALVLASWPSLWAWGQLEGCSTEGNSRIIPELLCVPRSPSWHSAVHSGLCRAISLLHWLPSQKKTSASFSCSSGSAWAATAGTAGRARARLVRRASSALCEELPSVTGLSPGSALSALSPRCRDPGEQQQQSTACRAVPRVYMQAESLWFSASFDDVDLLRMLWASFCLLWWCFTVTCLETSAMFQQGR